MVRDTLGEDRANHFPLTCYLAAGTQAERSHLNHLMVLRMSNLTRNKESAAHRDAGEDDDSDDDEDSEDEDAKAELESALIPHQGCVNRVRVCVRTVSCVLA